MDKINSTPAESVLNNENVFIYLLVFNKLKLKAKVICRFKEKLRKEIRINKF